MFLLVNQNDIIIGSAMNKPSKSSCSSLGYRIYEIDKSEFFTEMVGTKLVDFEIVEHVKDGNT